MKTKHFLAAIGICVTGSMFLASCVQRNDYPYGNNGNNGNNGNYYNHTTDTSYQNVFDEEFNGGDHYAWSFTDPTDSAYASISNGSYVYVDYSTVQSNMTVVNTGANTQGNFTVQTRIKSNNIMGLVFGASSSDNGYAFYIDTAGNYSLYKEGTGTSASTTIIPSTQDSLYAVKDNWNVLEIDQVGGNWTGYINGTQVFQMAARTISGSNFGFKVLPATVGYADYLVVKSN